MGYPKDILATRAVVRKNYAVIPPEGLVNNVVPGIENCRISIIASPKMGASFVQYLITANEGGGTTRPFGTESNTEVFIYVISGHGKFCAEGKEYDAPAGAYLFVPAGTGLEFVNTDAEPMRLILYKQVFIPNEFLPMPKSVYGNLNEVEYREYDEMANVFIKDCLPIDDQSYDMNFHVLSFLPGGCHPFVETHVQEHGAYILEGEGCYLLDDNWSMIKEGDFIWFGPYVAQAAYGVGTKPFTYIYSKDCNRDVVI